jgi:TMEM175 potassium channel family protein
VFAISITVLTLSLRLPAHTTDTGVAHALRKAIPSVFTYVLSFAVIGLYWIAHHRMFRYIDRLDAGLLLLNLAALCVVAFVPFLTSVLGDPESTTAAVVFYAATMCLLGCVVLALWIYVALHHRLIKADTPALFLKHSLWRGARVPVVFAASIPIAFANPHTAEWFWLLIVIGPVLLRRQYGSIYDP